MDELQRFARRLSPDERTQMIADRELVEPASELVRGVDGTAVPVDRFDELFDEVAARIEGSDWPTPSTSDAWLAPHLHNLLRLTRAQASDRSMWEWLAVRVAHYVRWRWQDRDGNTAEDRWRGPIHKQALARLWWGAEIFRNGSDYQPVRQAFRNQDLPNSLLHRPIVRCRPLALGLVGTLLSNGRPPTSREINDLARAVNLATAGSPPDVETGFHRDDVGGYRRWLAEAAPPVEDWDAVVAGPTVPDLPEQAHAAGLAIAGRGREYAERARRAQSE